jgi:hypothetical protein
MRRPAGTRGVAADPSVVAIEASLAGLELVEVDTWG